MQQAILRLFCTSEEVLESLAVVKRPVRSWHDAADIKTSSRPAFALVGSMLYSPSLNLTVVPAGVVFGPLVGSKLFIIGAGALSSTVSLRKVCGSSLPVPLALRSRAPKSPLRCHFRAICFSHGEASMCTTLRTLGILAWACRRGDVPPPIGNFGFHNPSPISGSTDGIATSADGALRSRASPEMPVVEE